MYLNFPHIDFGISISYQKKKKNEINDYKDFQFNGIPNIYGIYNGIYAKLLLCVKNYTHLKHNWKEISITQHHIHYHLTKLQLPWVKNSNAPY